MTHIGEQVVGIAVNCWHYVFHFPPNPGVCVVIGGLLGVIVTLKDENRKFKKWERFSLIAVLSVLSFGEIYAIQNDRQESEKVHAKEFSYQMDKFASVIEHEGTLQSTAQGLGKKIEDSNYVAMIRRHEDIRVDIDRLVSELSILGHNHGELRGRVDQLTQRFEIDTPSDVERKKAEREKGLADEDADYEHKYQTIIVPKVDALLKRIFIELREPVHSSKDYSVDRVENSQRAIELLHNQADRMKP